MAVETQTQGTTGEGRALGAALSAPSAFTGRTASMALHASDRHVDRWAPETNATSRSRALGTLSFVDRLLGPWLSGVAAPVRPGVATMGEGRLPSVSWVFPRPWYQDELDWMAAAREGGDQARAGLLTTRGTYAAPAPAPQVQRVMPPGVIAASVRSAGQTVTAVAEQPIARRTLQSELAYVAPSFSAGAAFAPEGDAGVVPSYTIASPAALPSAFASPADTGVRTMAPAAAIAAMAQQRSLRAWSPQVSFAAAQAAEVMSGVIGGVERASIATQGTASASSSPILEGLAYVAPAEMTETYAQARGAASTSSYATPASTAPIARAIAQLAAAQAVASVSSSSTPAVRADRAATVEAARIAVNETAAPVRASSTPSADAPAPSPAAIEYRAEQARVLASLDAPATETPSSFQQLVQLASSSPASAQAMRAVELMARSAITGTVAPVSGPRVALPAGLGGAVIGHDAAVTAHRPMVTMTAGETFAPVLDAQGAPIAPATRAAPTFQPVWTAPYTPSTPMQTMSAAAGPAPAPRMAASQAMPTAALAAIAAERPAAVDHLAWTDRWLARFAGASTSSLAAVDVASERSIAVPRALAAGAPEVVFVVPGLDEPARQVPVAAGAGARAPIAPQVRYSGAQATTQVPEAVRVADDVSTPDEVFAAIARTARPRMPAQPPSAIAGAAPGMPTVASAPAAPRPTMADRIARSAPTAPDAGLYAGLASSPMAPALAGVMPLPAAPVFDPRALYAGGVLSAYLGGAIARQVGQGAQGAMSGAPAMTLWPAMTSAPWIDAAPTTALADAPTLGVAARAPETTFVAPDSRDGETPIARATAPSTPTPTSIAPAATAAPRAPAPATTAWPSAVTAAAAADPTIWTLRADAPASASSGVAPTFAFASQAAGIGASGTALDAPLADVEPGAWTARPGMTAELAHGFAVHTERSAADLSFDFVSPEQVLAARVYGFGPIEAAQAARLAVSGPAGLAAMASAIDLTFLRQLHIESERSAAASAAGAEPTAAPRARREAPTMIPPVFDAAPSSDAPEARAVEVRATEVRAAEVRAAEVRAAEVRAAHAPAAAAPPVFGVGRRLPRGVFMWPSGAVAALDLRADLPEGAAAMQVAALELLAANAVAEMGALVAPAERGGSDEAFDAPAAAPGVRVSRALPASLAAPEMTTVAPSFDASSPGAEPAAEEVAQAIAVPPSQRARFESIYLSLSKSPAGLSMSPSVRAARALAIASHQGQTSDAGPTSAQERAYAAWSVMPMVFSGGAERESAAASATQAAAPTYAAMQRERISMDVYAPSTSEEVSRPGLSQLAARAGEAIGSYVQPTVSEVQRASSGAAAGGSSSQAQERSVREPFVHELIRQGRGFTRAGGGEVEIPSWFESAAKRMLEQRGLGENLSLAELTLVASAPAAQVAASGKTSSPVTPATSSPSGGEKAEQPDIEKIATEVYAEILKLLDVSRERSGDPWL